MEGGRLPPLTILPQTKVNKKMDYEQGKKIDYITYLLEQILEELKQPIEETEEEKEEIYDTEPRKRIV